MRFVENLLWTRSSPLDKQPERRRAAAAAAAESQGVGGSEIRDADGNCDARLEDSSEDEYGDVGFGEYDKE